MFDVTGGYGDLEKVLGAVCNATAGPCDNVDCNSRGTCVEHNDDHYCICDDQTQWEVRS